jgi:hypothetical protein
VLQMCASKAGMCTSPAFSALVLPTFANFG